MSPTSIEVELKFRAPDGDALRKRLRKIGGTPSPAVTQIDTYFAHPARDFAATDEALRVRIVGDSGRLTYKGPLLDAVTKSREETELPFAGGAVDAERFAAVLERLDFRPVRQVRKTREPWALDWQGRSVEVAFDSVEGLGDFVELETAADAGTFEAAKAALLVLAARLDLTQSERRSYLAMLLGR